MNRANLIKALAQKEKIKWVDAEAIVNRVFGEIVDALVRGEDVSLRYFGEFRVLVRAERQGRHPRTGEPITIPAKKVVRFSAALPVRKAVENQQQE